MTTRNTLTSRILAAGAALGLAACATTETSTINIDWRLEYDPKAKECIQIADFAEKSEAVDKYGNIIKNGVVVYLDDCRNASNPHVLLGGAIGLDGNQRSQVKYISGYFKLPDGKWEERNLETGEKRAIDALPDSVTQHLKWKFLQKKNKELFLFFIIYKNIFQ